MERFDIKRGFHSDIEDEKLGKLMDEIFGNVSEEDGWFLSNYGAMQPIKVKLLSKKELGVEITTVKIPDEKVPETMRKRNLFLEKATGFNSKQRLKKLKDKAKKGDL